MDWSDQKIFLSQSITNEFQSIGPSADSEYCWSMRAISHSWVLTCIWRCDNHLCLLTFFFFFFKACSRANVEISSVIKPWWFFNVFHLEGSEVMSFITDVQRCLQILWIFWWYRSVDCEIYTFFALCVDEFSLKYLYFVVFHKALNPSPFFILPSIFRCPTKSKYSLLFFFTQLSKSLVAHVCLSCFSYL